MFDLHDFLLRRPASSILSVQEKTPVCPGAIVPQFPCTGRYTKRQMSTITLEIPDHIAARLTTPEGMARAQAAVMAAFARD